MITPTLILAQGGARVEKHRKCAELAAQLQSDDPKVVAWAAHAASTQRLAPLIRNLVMALQTWRQRNSTSAEFVRLQVLDALVRVDAKLPAGKVLPHLNGITEVAAFVLLTREAKQNQRQLLELFRAPLTDGRVCKDMKWFVAGSLLCEQRAPGFAAAVLREVEFRLVISVYGPKDLRGIRCPGAMGWNVGRKKRKPIPGFPPVPVYLFTDPEKRGAQTLASGECPVAYTRSITTTAFPIGRSMYSQDDEWRWRWLKSLATFDQWPTGHKVLDFRTRAGFLKEATKEQRQLAASCRAIVAALVAAGAMTRAEADGLKIVPRVEVEDCRSDRAVKLPALSLRRRRRAMVAAVPCLVLAVVAWWTRPGYSEHEFPLVLKDWRGLTDKQLAAWNAPRPVTYPPSVKKFLRYWMDRGEPYYRNAIDFRDAGLFTYAVDKRNDPGRIRSVGMFGRVWVLK